MALFGKRHYVVIAALLKQLRADYDKRSVGESGAIGAINLMTDELGNFFEQDSERFDAVRFATAAGRYS